MFFVSASNFIIGKWYHFFRVAIKIGFPGSGLFLIPTSTPLASIPDRIRNSPKVSANAKNQLHEKEEIWILANYHLRIGFSVIGYSVKSDIFIPYRPSLVYSVLIEISRVQDLEKSGIPRWY